MRVSYVVLAVLAAATLSCTEPNGLPAPFARSSSELPMVAGAPQSADDIRRHYAAWKQQNLSRYRVEQQRGCFCGAPVPAVIEVVGDTVVRAWGRSTGEQLSSSRQYTSVDSLFAHALSVVEGGGTVIAAFDVALHYPRDIRFDPQPGWADDEFEYRLGRLVSF